MKILVVDDSRTMRRIIRNALEGAGYSKESVIEAGDGLEALSTLDREKVDLVLADWNMPNMDGLTLVKKLKSRNVPVIMITGEAQRDRVAEAIGAGARNYIVKPFTPETLRQKVLDMEKECSGNRPPTDTAIIRKSKADNSALPFLARLPEEIAAGILELARSSEHRSGETLLSPGDHVDGLMVVERGRVEVDSGDGSPPDVRSRGECFGEVAFLSSEPSAITVRAQTDAAVATVERADFETLLSRHPHLSFHLTKLLTKHACKPDIESGLSGKLSMMPLTELVQTLNSSQKTGVLRLRHSGEEGKVSFESGEVRYAEVSGIAGEEAFYQLIAWTDGLFSFDAGQSDCPKEIFRTTMSLLMEGMRRQDEQARSKA